MRNGSLKFACFLSVFAVLLPNPAHGFDSSDTAPPTIKVKIMDSGNQVPGVSILSLDLFDEKNGVALKSSYINSLVGIPLSSAIPSDIAPVCTHKNYLGLSMSIYSGDDISVEKFGNKSRTFYMLIKAQPMDQLPTGCPEWRKPTENVLENVYYDLQVLDEAGNGSKLRIILSDYFGKSFPISSGKDQWCFRDIDPKSEVGAKVQFESLIKLAYGMKSTDPKKKSAILAFQTRYLKIPEQYLKKMSDYGKILKNPFEPTKLQKLPLCKEVYDPTALKLDEAISAAAVLQKQLRPKAKIAVPIPPPPK
jgi:hypothetical protein